MSIAIERNDMFEARLDQIFETKEFNSHGTAYLKFKPKECVLRLVDDQSGEVIEFELGSTATVYFGHKQTGHNGVATNVKPSDRMRDFFLIEYNDCTLSSEKRPNRRQPIVKYRTVVRSVRASRSLVSK